MRSAPLWSFLFRISTRTRWLTRSSRALTSRRCADTSSSKSASGLLCVRSLVCSSARLTSRWRGPAGCSFNASVRYQSSSWRSRTIGNSANICLAIRGVRGLHELLWYLAEALKLQPAGPLHRDVSRALEQTRLLTHKSPDALLELDVSAHRREVNALLLRVSDLVRVEIRNKKDHRGADLIGADLQDTDLRGASLRGAYLIGADLRCADLRMADLTAVSYTHLTL